MSDELPQDGWFRVHVPVRFRDLDAMGHAHHTVPLICLEEARAAFWRDIKGGAADLAAIDYVMAEITLRFHARMLYPATVTVGLAVRHAGNSSFRTDFEIRDEMGALLSDGSAVQVSYDYEAGRSKPLSADDRARLEAWRAAAEPSQDRTVAMMAETAPIPPPST